MSTTTATLVIPTVLLALLERPKTDKQGKAVEGETRKIRAAEVAGWADHGDLVVVVTVDGQKYTAEIPADVRKKLDKEAAPDPSSTAP